MPRRTRAEKIRAQKRINASLTNGSYRIEGKIDFKPKESVTLPQMATIPVRNTYVYRDLVRTTIVSLLAIIFSLVLYWWLR